MRMWLLWIVVFIALYFASGWATTVVCRSNTDSKSSLFRPFFHCKCDNCGDKIDWLRSLPFIGILLQKGRAECCEAKIPIKYTIIEFLLLTGQFLIFMLMPKNNSWIVFGAVVAFYAAFVTVAAIIINGSKIKYQSVVIGILYGVICQHFFIPIMIELSHKV